MKKEPSQVKDRIVTLRMNKDQFTQMVNNRKKTTERTNSNYLRKLALNEPVIVKYRNQSLDEFTSEIIALKKELNFIGHNFNQAVHKLHTLDKIPEFRNWALAYDQTRRQIETHTQSIVSHAQKLIQQWP